MMQLEGYCRCGQARFGVDSFTPCLYRFCCCTGCLETHGDIGGVASLMGEANTLRVAYKKQFAVYSAFSNPPGTGIPPVELMLHDCRSCGRISISTHPFGQDGFIQPPLQPTRSCRPRRRSFTSASRKSPNGLRCQRVQNTFVSTQSRMSQSKIGTEDTRFTHGDTVAF